MTIHEFPKTREQSLREARITNLYTALYLIECEDEVRLALKDVHRDNLKCLGRIVHEILNPKEPA